MAKKKQTSVDRQNDIQKKMALAQKRALAAPKPEYLYFLDGETKIILPYQIFRMQFDNDIFSKVQQNVIMEMFFHIREKLLKKLSPENSDLPLENLFSPEDFLDESEKGKFLLIEMKLKDFGVKPNHYDTLRGALGALSSFVIKLPYIDGQKRTWTAFTPLFDKVLVGEGKYKTDCIFKIKKEMADKIIDMKLGFGKIGRNASHSLRTKYAGRVHMLLSQNADVGGFTVSMEEFRRMMGIQKKYLSDWNKVETFTLLDPKEEIDKRFSEGLCDYSYTYEPVYNNRPEVGFPDAIKFTIHSATSTAEKNLILLENSRAEQFKNMLNQTLNVPLSTCSTLSKRITAENGLAALSKIAELDAWLQEHEIRTSKAIFVTKAMNNFFDTFAAALEEKKALPPIKKWQKITEFIGKSYDLAVSQVLGNILFESYNEQENIVYLQAPSKEYAMKEINPHVNILSEKIKQYFDNDTIIQFTYKE